MKMIRLCLAALAIGTAWSDEAMTPKRFKELVAAPEGNQALRPELASVPMWKKSKVSMSVTYQDGKVFKEECPVTAKVVDGGYIVMAVESKFYKQTMYSIMGYDEKALAIRQWGLFGETLTEATVIADPIRKVTASVARYGEGFEELTASIYSEKEISSHTVVYKNGMRFLTREAITRPTEDAAPASPR